MDKWLIAILILAVALLIVFRSGAFYWNDDGTYLTFVQAISQHSFNPALNPFSYGWAFPYFIYLSGALFSNTAYGYAILATTLEYLSLIVLTYILASRLANDQSPWIPRIASMIVAISPFMLQIATRVLNDALLGTMAALALIFYTSNKQRDWLLAGLIAGLMPAIKLIGLAFILPLGLYIILNDLLLNRMNKRGIYAICGLIMGLGIYLLPFLMLVHNPLYPFQAYGTYQAGLSPSSPQLNLFTLLTEFGVMPSLQVGDGYWQAYSYGILLWLALAGTVLAHKNRNKPMFFMAVIFWGFMLYIHFGTITLHSYHVQTVVSRYLALVVAPMAILCAYAYMSIFYWLRKYPPIINIAALAIILVIGWLIMAHTYALIYHFNTLIRTCNYAQIARLIGWKLPANATAACR